MAAASLFEEPRPAKPQGKTVYAHCDGGARGNPGPAGYGAVVAAEDGTVLAELSEYLGKRTNNYAEYSGLLGVLAWTLEQGYTSLRVVSDSELMVKQVQGKYKVNSPDLRPLFEEARRRIAQLGSFQIAHALRHKNKDADRLANEAMDRGMGRGPASSPVVPVRETSAAGRAVSTHVPDAGHDAGHGAPRVSATPANAPAAPGEMLRGFVRDGAIHLLGGRILPDGVFVKVVRD